MRLNRTITDPHIAKALAHPLRVRILGLLEERTASPRELADELQVDLGVVSYHVRALARKGLLTLVSEKPRRGAVQHYYRATEHPVITSDAWGALPSVAKQTMLEATLRQLAGQVNGALSAGGFDRPASHLTRSPLVLDEQGFQEVATILERLVEDFERIAGGAERRLAARGHEGELHATAVLMLFETLAAVPSEAEQDGPGHGASEASFASPREHG